MMVLLLFAHFWLMPCGICLGSEKQNMTGAKGLLLVLVLPWALSCLCCAPRRRRPGAIRLLPDGRSGELDLDHALDRLHRAGDLGRQAIAARKLDLDLPCPALGQHDDTDIAIPALAQVTLQPAGRFGVILWEGVFRVAGSVGWYEV